VLQTREGKIIMPLYQAPIQDSLFCLRELLDVESLSDLSGFDELNAELIEAVLNEAARLCQDTLLPLNQVGDRQGCTRYEDGSVTTPEGFKQAYEAYVEGGWNGLSADPDYGGQGLPYTLAACLNEFLSSANMSFAMYPGLTHGAISALMLHGSEEQKQCYVPKMVEGVWTGTMNLTEPQCGTDLGLLKTKAVRQEDGSYHLTGQKIFISAGEHDLADNIIHLVLARIEGAPEGTKGISLFVVPKFIVKEDGSPGQRNAVSCGSLEEKMGIHGNATCVMNFDGATGWLVGEENKGLKAMFTMMNEARLGVGVQGLSQSEIAYQNAAAYAKDRLQGRSLSGAKYPEKPADPLLVHPDIRLILLDIRSFNEGARALMLWTALQGDISHRSGDEAARQKADDFMGLMTPVIKGVLTDVGFDNCVKAQQVFGGHGYIEEWGMSQYVRDARIAMIYEGANGIQALDLVGRKLPKDGGRAVMSFFTLLEQWLKEHERDDLQPYCGPLSVALKDLQAATMWFMQNAMGKPDHAGAGATDYMHLFGQVAIGWMWARMASIAGDKIHAGEGDVSFYKTKLVLARHYMERCLPETALRRKRIEAGSNTLMGLEMDAF
jgi:acyl-CoA dehydrogenase